MDVKKMTKHDVLTSLQTIRMAFDSASKVDGVSKEFRAECDKVWNYLHNASSRIAAMNMDKDDVVHEFRENG